MESEHVVGFRGPEKAIGRGTCLLRGVQILAVQKTASGRLRLASLCPNRLLPALLLLRPVRMPAFVVDMCQSGVQGGQVGFLSFGLLIEEKRAAVLLAAGLRIGNQREYIR